MRLTPEQQQLAEDNIKLAYFAANKFSKTFTWIELEEIQSACLLGLTKSAQTYNPERSKFSTYAMTVMYRQVQREFVPRKEQAVVVSLDYFLVNIGDNNLDWNDVLSDGSSLEDEAVCKILGEQIPDIIDNLKTGKTYKKILKTHYADPDLTQQQIADRIGCKQKTVSLAYGIAREKIKPLIYAV